MNTLRRLIELPLMFVGAVCALAIMLITAADVVARYLFSSPIDGAYEIVQTLLAIGILAALPLVGVRSEHISVSFVEGHGLGGAGRWLSFVFSCLMALILATIAQRLWLLSDLVAANGQTLGAYAIPLGPLYRTLSILAAIAALLQFVVVAPSRLARISPRGDTE